MKPNWVCSKCGMWSNRKFSVKRHVVNQHKGNAFLVTFIDYLVGRQSGLYQPSSPPEHQKTKQKSYLDIYCEEFWKEKARIIARQNVNFQV